jgi:four helix bundle protein
MKDYRNLVVWQKAHQMVLMTYKTTLLFPAEERYNLIGQLRRASTSIPTNIAEGCGKSTQKDFAYVLQVALGSTQEVEYLNFLSNELGYTGDTEYKNLKRAVGEVKAMLIALIKKIKH